MFLQVFPNPKKNLPCKYMYDEEGARLFDRICESNEYYLTRTELSIMKDHAGEMAAIMGSQCLLIEYGSGAGVKTRILLDHLDNPAGYVPVDISGEYLQRSNSDLKSIYPDLDILCVCSDFTSDFELPRPKISESSLTEVISYSHI